MTEPLTLMAELRQTSSAQTAEQDAFSPAQQEPSWQEYICCSQQAGSQLLSSSKSGHLLGATSQSGFAVACIQISCSAGAHLVGSFAIPRN